MKNPFEYFTATITSDQIPKNAKYVTQDECGTIDFFNELPSINGGNLKYWCTDSGSSYSCISELPKNPNWKEALTTPEEIKAYEDWLADGWIPWSGGDCPVPDGTLVEVKFSGLGSSKVPYLATTFRWSKTKGWADIIAYRVIKEAPKQEPNYKEILKFVTGEKFDQTVADYDKLEAAKNLFEQHGYSVTKI